MANFSEDSPAVFRWWNSLVVGFQRSFRAPRPGFTEPLIPTSPMVIALSIIVVGLIVESMLFWDGQLIRLVRANRSGMPWVQWFFQWLTILGESQWVIIVALAFGVPLSMTRWSQFPRAERRRKIELFADLNFAFFTVVTTGVLASLIKNTIGRARPKHLETLGELYFKPGAFESAFASFPSGHSTTFGATCMMLALLSTRHRWVWLIVALLGGLSRLMVGAHYLSDAIAGLAFGAGLTLLAARWLAQRGTMFRFTGTLLPTRKRR